MTKSLTKVIYKPDSQSTDEYIAIINPEQVSIPHFTSENIFILGSFISGKKEVSIAFYLICRVLYLIQNISQTRIYKSFTSMIVIGTYLPLFHSSIPLTDVVDCEPTESVFFAFQST